MPGAMQEAPESPLARSEPMSGFVASVAVPEYSEVFSELCRATLSANQSLDERADLDCSCEGQGDKP